MSLRISTLGWILGSIFSSTSIIILNKHIMDIYRFNSPTFLTAFHMLMTWTLLELLCHLRLIDRATTFPQTARIAFAAVMVGGVIFMNFNLKMNSVGFYQLSKLLCIPSIVLYELVFHRRRTPFKTLVALAILLVGIALFTVNDVQVNFAGTIIACLAVVFVAVSQTKTGTIQNAYNITAPSAQHATAFSQFVIALSAALCIETTGSKSILTHHFQMLEVILIIVTGFVSVSVNVCGFGLIGKTSAVTYQVVGHCKTILIFVSGIILFPARQGETRAQFIKKIAGLVISMIGMILYTAIQLRTKAAEAQVREAELSKLLVQNDEPSEEEQEMSIEVQEAKE
jgi:solute carrier family 35 protein E3